MKHLAQIGCLARSIVYFAVGVLALLLAMGNSYGETTDESGVMRRLVDRPHGHFIVLSMAAGLLCYAVWRLFQSVQDHDRYGHSIYGLSIRGAFLVSGIAYGFLGFYALNLVFEFMHTTRVGERVMAKWVMMQPYGRVILWILGLSVVIVGFIQFVRAFNGAFVRDLRITKNHRVLMNICRFGLVARGIVFCIIGTFFMQAAWKYRSKEAGGLHKAWETLREQPNGNWVVAAVAIGFMAFAVFGLIEGFYRKRTG